MTLSPLFQRRKNQIGRLAHRRQDDAGADGVALIPFAYVEAAANILTNPALDPFGKIPEVQVLRRARGEGRTAPRGGGVSALRFL